MASQSKGKKFEQQIREDFEKVTHVSVDRIPDQTMHHKGAVNVADFIVYKKPYEYYIECKTVHGNTFPFSNIKDGQWDGLWKKCRINGVRAGIICWWVDKDVTRYIPIEILHWCRDCKHMKSIRYDFTPFPNDQTVITPINIIDIKGQKKRTYYSYDMEDFFEQIERGKYVNGI